MSSNKIVEKKIPVRGVNCAKCRLDIENILSRVDGVADAKMDYMSGVVSVKYDYSRVDLPELERLIENLGYNVAYKDYEGGLARLKGLLKKKRALRKIDDHTFSGLVLETVKPVVLLVYRGDCGGCERLESFLASLASDFKDKIYFYKLDCSFSSICKRYNISQTPVVLIFQAGLLRESLPSSIGEGEVKRRVAVLLNST
ncbi:MAG: cation transporter [Candidatus Odinarchaeum yellowstonii]|uniref:Cation transporter n=1 Tax=Odinarchaeota yellowstonii (strain LCB_4) TaxID=1841599 RepID=A0AAF0D2A1_ODILC|nr:MAG: cation transporter [Candidatus Odinarchaeum yellowstonii]